MALDLSAAADLPCGIGRARAELETLDNYPRWLGIVWDATRADPSPDDRAPAWWVELGGRFGLIRRTKTVRMVRSVSSDTVIRFERRELDGRAHNDWILEVRLEPRGGDETGVEMAVHYGGDRRIPVVDAMLRAEVRRAGRRLVERVAAVG